MKVRLNNAILGSTRPSIQRPNSFPIERGSQNARIACLPRALVLRNPLAAFYATTEDSISKASDKFSVATAV